MGAGGRGRGRGALSRAPDADACQQPQRPHDQLALLEVRDDRYVHYQVEETRRRLRAPRRWEGRRRRWWWRELPGPRPPPRLRVKEPPVAEPPLPSPPISALVAVDAVAVPALWSVAPPSPASSRPPPPPPPPPSPSAAPAPPPLSPPGARVRQAASESREAPAPAAAADFSDAARVLWAPRRRELARTRRHSLLNDGHDVHPTQVKLLPAWRPQRPEVVQAAELDPRLPSLLPRALDPLSPALLPVTLGPLSRARPPSRPPAGQGAEGEGLRRTRVSNEASTPRRVSLDTRGTRRRG